MVYNLIEVQQHGHLIKQRTTRDISPPHPTGQKAHGTSTDEGAAVERSELGP